MKLSSDFILFKKKPTHLDALIPSDVVSGSAVYGPAVFWLSNPNNTFTNNVAVASPGSGIWIELEAVPIGLYSFFSFEVLLTLLFSGKWVNSGYAPNKAPYGLYRNNYVHGTMEGFTTCSLYHGELGPQNPSQIWSIDNLVVYNSYIGMYFLR